MNKTININLGGLFYHIDEEAYERLQNYLNAIKASLSNSADRDEILGDIEARIGELFSEKLESERQVINNQQVDEVIAVMGQPEDYRIDDEEPMNSPPKQTTTKTSKRLMRDPNDAYISGASSGLGHYLGIDVVWVRVLWVLLTFITGGATIPIYILLWIIMPKAVTTADHLAMRGSTINVNTIESGYSEYNNTPNNKFQTSSRSFFERLPNILKTLFGVFLVFVSASVLLGLTIDLFSWIYKGFFDTVTINNIAAVNYDNLPTATTSILRNIAIGIPFFFTLMYGLRLLMKKLNPTKKVLNYALISIWVFAIAGLVAMQVRKNNLKQYKSYVQENAIPLNDAASDTLYLSMKNDNRLIDKPRHHNGYQVKTTTEGQKLIVMQNVNVIIKEYEYDSIPSITIKKSARGKNIEEAQKNANDIVYNFNITDNNIYLNGYATSLLDNKYHDNEITIALHIPDGTTIFADETTRSYLSRSDDGISLRGKQDHYATLSNGRFDCADCQEDFDIHIDEDSKISINENGIYINGSTYSISVNENGIDISKEN